jgi:hypothetical protein
MNSYQLRDTCNLLRNSEKDYLLKQQSLYALLTSTSAQNDSNEMKQLPINQNKPQNQHVHDACVIEEMVVGNDGHQIFVCTTGAPLIVKKMGAGSRAMQFAGSVSDESFMCYMKTHLTK